MTRSGFALTREVADTRQRIALGGLFYLAGWVVVSSVAPVYPRHALAGAAASPRPSLLLAALRVLLRAPAVDQAPARLQRWLDLQWMVMLSTAGLWGGVLSWTLLEPAFEPARTPALLCSIAYATAFAHTFTARLRRAFVGIALIYLPAPCAAGPIAGDDLAVAVTMAVYYLYLLLTLLRSHREYQASPGPRRPALAAARPVRTAQSRPIR